MELLIDGARYKLWKPTDEAVLEDIVKEHAKEIFGEDAIYFDIKQKIKSQAGIGSIPDGYVITLGNPPRWYIVEVELSSHPLFEHIVPQMNKFIHGIKNLISLRKIVEALHEEISTDEALTRRIQSKIGSTEVFKFLSDLISHAPKLAIVIEQDTEELREAVDGLKLETKVVEFKTFEKEGVGLAVHAHLFESLWKPVLIEVSSVVTVHEKKKLSSNNARVTIQDLLNAGLVQAKQKIFKDYKGKRYEAEILSSSKVKLFYDGTEWNSLSGASDYITQTSTDGWVWWYTIANGEEVLMDVLRNKYRLL